MSLVFFWQCKKQQLKFKLTSMAEFSMKLEPSAADDDKVYYPGQKLNGTVKLSLNSSKDVNGEF